MKTFAKDTAFILKITADGSPSLATNTLHGELMHSVQGAFSETCYVYEPVIDAMLKKSKARLFSLGLGLGYVEMLAAAKWLQACKAEDLEIHSFESSDELRRSFLDWLQNNETTLLLPYQGIAARFEQHFHLQPGSLRHALKDAHEKNRLYLHPALTSTTQHLCHYDGFCFDAFSQKTNPELWEESLLTNVLSHAHPTFATFATYAATTRLKQILKRFGFTADSLSRKGFANKRECIFAIKNSLLKI